MTDAEKQTLADLSAKVNTLSETVDKLDVAGVVANAVTAAVTEAMKPLADKVDALNASETAKAEAEKTALVNRVVEAGLLDEDAAKELTVKALNALAANAAPAPAFGLNGAFAPNAGKDDLADYSLNAQFEEAK